MPTFEFRCGSCGHEFEYLKLHSSPEPSCPACGGDELERLLSLPAISSEGTRARSRRSARRRGRAIRHEKAHEDHKELHRHLDEDH